LEAERVEKRRVELGRVRSFGKRVRGR